MEYKPQAGREGCSLRAVHAGQNAMRARVIVACSANVRFTSNIVRISGDRSNLKNAILVGHSAGATKWVDANPRFAPGAKGEVG